MDLLLARPEAAEPLGLYGREAVKEELRRAIAAGETEPDALLALGPRLTPLAVSRRPSSGR